MSVARKIDFDTVPTGDERPDTYAGAKPKLLTPETLIKLTKINDLVSAFYVFQDYALIFLTAYLVERFWHPAFYLLAVMFIGSRQFGFLILAHDASHFLLFKNKSINEFVGHYILKVPVLQNLFEYRKSHIAHHRFLLTEKDPDLMRKLHHVLPISKKRLVVRVLFNFLGFSSFRRMYILYSKNWFQRSAFLIGSAAFLFCVFQGYEWARLVFMYWVVPMMTWMMMISDIRTSAQHWVDGRFDISRQDEVLYGTPIVEASWLEKIFIIRYNANLHLNHHLYPSVPIHKGQELYRELLKIPAYRDRVHILKRYFPDVVSYMLGRTKKFPPEQEKLAAENPLPFFS